MLCRKCGEEKELDLFPKHERVCKQCRVKRVALWQKNNPEKVKKSRQNRSEKLSAYHKMWKEKNPEKVLANHRKYRELNIEKCRESALKYYRKNKIKCRNYRIKNSVYLNEKKRENRLKNIEKHRQIHRERQKIYRIKKPKEHLARKKVYYAIKNGFLKRDSTCLLCGSEEKIEAHHRDYDKPLDVVWLCRICHNGVHLTMNRLLWEDKNKEHGK